MDVGYGCYFELPTLHQFKDPKVLDPCGFAGMDDICVESKHRNVIKSANIAREYG